MKLLFLSAKICAVNFISSVPLIFAFRGIIPCAVVREEISFGRMFLMSLAKMFPSAVKLIAGVCR